MDLAGLILATLVDENRATALLRGLRARDPEALAKAYDAYGRTLYVVILRIVQNPAIAEELLQEAFLRAWKAADRLDEDYGGIGPWLMGIARNCALDYKKSPKSRTSSLDFDVTAPRMNPEDSVLSVERAELLENAFRELSANQKRVIEMAYYEGMSQAVIADHLAVPLGTVKTWTRSALGTLRGAVGSGLGGPTSSRYSDVV
jgi:RNA polymerase sigma-70 factor (ECF subfamily)